MAGAYKESMMGLIKTHGHICQTRIELPGVKKNSFLTIQYGHLAQVRHIREDPVAFVFHGKPLRLVWQLYLAQQLSVGNGKETVWESTSGLLS